MMLRTGYFYRSDTDDGMKFPDSIGFDDFFVVRDCDSYAELEKVNLNGRPHVYVPGHPHRYIDLARLTLSTFGGKPPEGRWRIGYIDCDKRNCKPDNLYWRAEWENSDAFSKGRIMATNILHHMNKADDPEGFLRGVNQELYLLLKKTIR